MKVMIRGLATKVLSIVLIAALLCGGVYLLRSNTPDESEHETISNVDVVKEKLEATAELNTGIYLCTSVYTSTDSKKFNDWNVPFTKNSFIISYDGSVRAGIKDLTKTEVAEDGDTVHIKLPKIEITGVDIDNDSFQILNESNNIFNPISIQDINDAQKELKEKMVDSAIEKGVLNIAKNNAETVLGGMLASTNGEYKVIIEWQQ